MSLRGQLEEEEHTVSGLFVPGLVPEPEPEPEPEPPSPDSVAST